MSVKIAIIGGTGVYDPTMLTDLRQVEVDTVYGKVAIKVGRYQEKEVAFLQRHGEGHSVPPHLINYRANILALKKLGVRQIIATAAVGSLDMKLEAGHLVVVHDFLDFTKVRPTTFFDGGEAGVVHTDFTYPYCPRLRNVLLEAGRQESLTIHDSAVYVCTEGPRFETPTEIKMYQNFGGHLVGMTSVPEVLLAREAEICYATVAMVTNYGAGISPQPLTHMEVLEAMDANKENIKSLAMKTIELLPTDDDCECHHALADFGGFKL
ncbi:S-methyl-5'-thioadenosine phosphorylase [Heliorestis acidaminivorans]|uniref:Purine nucleoside phosphorylase n=1 Tax=Heliorestis acidaminivorans TaxID=553427 RepID=A0A6I0F0G3_9FIRM|nr:S-methyl-5'-thioadenosine phosphorylase [Heliorestis acidaminivorans]KAB2954436.1 S-methyl-5'-thioadenosine phosphorylase [Heliorestis acidaminivorans]